MAYITKKYREKIIGYFKDLDYCYRHWHHCYYKPDSVSKEYFMSKQRQFYAMYELFLKLLETL